MLRLALATGEPTTMTAVFVVDLARPLLPPSWR
jgi:hypothetical protein